MKDQDCVHFLQWALPKMSMLWDGFRKVRRQVCRRITHRIDELSLGSFNNYRDFLTDNYSEWELLDSFCRITISRFYRDRQLFDYLIHNIFPELAQNKDNNCSHVRCLSIGCASGEEIYTVNLLWKIYIEDEYSIQLSSLAVDSSEAMLERGRKAIYSPGSVRDVPQEVLSIAFNRYGNEYLLKEDFKKGIIFQCRDIRLYEPPGLFHMIFCRNLVFTYFDEQLQIKILEIVIGHLVKGGVLIIGNKEGLPIIPDILERHPEKSTIYRKLSH